MDDHARECLEEGSNVREGRGVAADHEGERAVLGADRPAGEGGFEITSAGRVYAVVLRAFDVRVDGGRIDDDLSGAERVLRLVEHTDHVA